MTDPVNYAQITLTELEDGSVQYDIIPHDQTEERAMVLLNKDGVLSIRDEDGEYMPIAGTQTGFISEYAPIDIIPFDLVEEGVQVFEDMENNVGISLSRNDQGALVIEVDYEDDSRTQFIGAIPEYNSGFEQRTLVIEDEIGGVNAETSPGGVEPHTIPPSFKI